MFNRAIIIGRLTKDAETKQTQSGKLVCSFTVAVNRRFNREETDFINCTAWNKTAEFIPNHFGKGDCIGVEGAITVRNFEDRNGNKRTSTEISAENVFFVGGKTNSGNGKTSADAENDQFEQIEEDGEDLPF